MATTRTYVLDAAPPLPVRTECRDTTPARALRQLVALAGLALVSQDGRYGRTSDGTRVAALTVDAGRARYADHGTTRFGG